MALASQENGMASRKSGSPTGTKKAAEDSEQTVTDFPRHTLQQTLQLATALEEKNGGNPLAPLDLAIALGRGPASSDYRVMLSSSIRYGLTSGSHTQARVVLQELGREIVQPRSDEDRRRALIRAALKPNVFRQIYEYYKGKRLPDESFFRNILLREFKIARPAIDAAAKIFLANMSFVGLVRKGATGTFLGSADDIGPVPTLREPEDVDHDDVDDGVEDLSERTIATPSATGGSARSSAAISKAIFIAHGRAKEPLRQLTSFLAEYRIPYKVAVDEPNVGRPISEKVADIMRECGAAIAILSADEEFTNKKGESVFRPSENVVFELGAAGVLYGSRLVIFKEKDVVFPTNFRDVGYIEFEKDQLSAKTNELFRELIAFGLIKVSVSV
jgi:predicted nucleotide-binding protein